jgi:hypothetical protein
MNTQNVNVKTATKKSSERWVKTIGRILDDAHSNVACAEEASEHYGEKFTAVNACICFVRGVMAAMFEVFKIKMRINK